MTSGNAGERGSVLVVDDDAITRKAIARLVGRRFRVSTVASADAALSLLVLQHFDAVLTDYRMVAMTGLELLEQVRLHYPDTRRVLMSSHSVPGIAGHIASGDVQVFLHKPLDLASVVAALSGAA
jgi:DNA-binding NtrC family response regulator